MQPEKPVLYVYIYRWSVLDINLINENNSDTNLISFLSA